jgi:carbon starvation protein
MNSITVLILGLVVFFVGYRVYAKRIDSRVIKSDARKATPAKMHMDGVEFMPVSRNILFGYQFISIAGVGAIVGPMVAIQWGWLPALMWILLGTLFIGWVQDYSCAMMAIRKDGASLAQLSYTLVSPRARTVFRCLVCFFLLVVAGSFGNIAVEAATAHKSSPLGWLFLTIGGLLAGQMIFRWKKSILLCTLVCVLIALFGVWLGTVAPSDKLLGTALSGYRPLWAVAVLIFCCISAVLPIWRFALPISYVASCIVFLGLVFGIIGILVLHPDFTLPAYAGFEIETGPIWPIMFLTIGGGAVSGWHGIATSYGTARLLGNEMHARPVCGGAVFVEMALAVFALIVAGTIYASSSDYAAALTKGPAGIFTSGTSTFLGALGMPALLGKSYGGVMWFVLAVTILQLVIRFLRIAVSELLGDMSPIFRNAHVGTAIAGGLTLILILTKWWQYLWMLFAGLNLLLASLALMLATAFLMSEGKTRAWTFYPMIFMFLMAMGALLFTSYSRFEAVFSGPIERWPSLGKMLMGLLAVFLIIGAIILALEGIKAFRRHRSISPQVKDAPGGAYTR